MKVVRQTGLYFTLLGGGLLSLFLLLISALFVFPNNITNATSAETDLSVEIQAVIALSLTNCDSSDSSTIKVSVEPTPVGVFKSNCQTVNVQTNAPGYTLTAKSSSSTLNYLNPTTVSPTPTIASTTSPTTSPTTLANDTWGFAVEGRLNFDNSYSTDNPNNTFAQLPTAETTIYSEDSFPITESDHTFYYGTKLTTDTMAGTYATTITYTGITAEVPMPRTHCGTPDEECIVFTVDVGDTGTYSIPTSGRVAAITAHTYDWLVYVDDVLVNSTNSPCSDDGNCTGTSSTSSDGIALTNLSSGTHQIRITPNHDTSTSVNSTSGSIAGWGNAFGHYNNTSGANAATNKNKLITLDAPLTTMAFAPKATESTTTASYMFANFFHNCTNLTTAMEINDTYTLPGTITDLSYFLYGTHNGNTQLVAPINLSPLDDWFYYNESITNLTGFLYSTHNGNTQLVAPINLSPVKDWFYHNSSVTNLSSFLYGAHNGNTQLVAPINLSPVKDWFYQNNSITDLSGLFHYAYYSNASLTTTIDLTPVKNWFYQNNSIINLSNFFFYTHASSASLTTTIDFTPVKDWFYQNNSIINLSSFLHNTHQLNVNQAATVDLDPFKDWFYQNESITNLSNFLQSTHGSLNRLTEPINLAPLSDWFYQNNSITNLSNFLTTTHQYNSNITVLIDLAPLSSWFGANRTMTTLSGFMRQTQDRNNYIVLTGQKILPNWIKTMTDGSGVALYNTGTTTSNYSFYQTFYRASVQTIDTEEIKFGDGTPLSSLGEPSVNRQTYSGRNGLTNLLQNDGWQ